MLKELFWWAFSEAAGPLGIFQSWDGSFQACHYSFIYLFLVLIVNLGPSQKSGANPMSFQFLAGGRLTQVLHLPPPPPEPHSSGDAYALGPWPPPGVTLCRYTFGVALAPPMFDFANPMVILKPQCLCIGWPFRLSWELGDQGRRLRGCQQRPDTPHSAKARGLALPLEPQTFFLLGSYLSSW